MLIVFRFSYACLVLGLDIQSENVRVTSIAGDHFSGKTDSDVNSIFFYEGTLNYLPNGIGNIFRAFQPKDKIFFVLFELTAMSSSFKF